MDGNLLRYLAIYMPHGGQDDADVEGVYSELDDLVCGARRANRLCILLGDWNAVVSPYHLGDDENIVGPYGGIGIRNGRGEWLVEWASSQRLTIADTLFEKHFDDQWTYQNGLTKRQLDYCLIDVGHAQEIPIAGAAELIGVGMDHRTIKLRLALPSSVRRHGRRKRGRRQTCSMRGWRPIADGVYQSGLDARLTTIDSITTDLEQRCIAFEKALLEAATECQERAASDQNQKDFARERMHALIQQRRDARREGCKGAVKEASKTIQKELRAVRKARQRSVKSLPSSRIYSASSTSEIMAVNLVCPC